jgi:ribosome-binding protein aMBF1 (putative translation factor)
MKNLPIVNLCFEPCELCGMEYVSDSRDSWRLVTLEDGSNAQVCIKCAEKLKSGATTETATR